MFLTYYFLINYCLSNYLFPSSVGYDLWWWNNEKSKIIFTKYIIPKLYLYYVFKKRLYIQMHVYKWLILHKNNNVCITLWIIEIQQSSILEILLTTCYNVLCSLPITTIIYKFYVSSRFKCTRRTWLVKSSI